jgi:hypothetical protein
MFGLVRLGFGRGGESSSGLPRGCDGLGLNLKQEAGDGGSGWCFEKEERRADDRQVNLRGARDDFNCFLRMEMVRMNGEGGKEGTILLQWMMGRGAYFEGRVAVLGRGDINIPGK